MTVIHSGGQSDAIEACLRRWRIALGCGFIHKNATVHALLAEIRGGHSIGVLMDQRHDTANRCRSSAAMR